MNRIDRVTGYTLGNVGSKSGVIALWIIHYTICIEPNVRNNRIQCKYENVNLTFWYGILIPFYNYYQTI